VVIEDRGARNGAELSDGLAADAHELTLDARRDHRRDVIGQKPIESGLDSLSRAHTPVGSGEGSEGMIRAAKPSGEDIDRGGERLRRRAEEQQNRREREGDADVRTPALFRMR